LSKPTQLSEAAHAMLDGMWVAKGMSKGIDAGVAQGQGLTKLHSSTFRLNVSTVSGTRWVISAVQ
jgi:hypothetical protein